MRQKLDEGQAMIGCISKTWSEIQFRNFSFDIWRMTWKQGNNVQITRWCAALGINTTFNALLFQVEAERSWGRYDENKLRTTQEEEGEGEGGSEIVRSWKLSEEVKLREEEWEWQEMELLMHIQVLLMSLGHLTHAIGNYNSPNTIFSKGQSFHFRAFSHLLEILTLEKWNLIPISHVYPANLKWGSNVTFQNFNPSWKFKSKTIISNNRSNLNEK